MALSKRVIFMIACVGIHLVRSTSLDVRDSNLMEVPPAPADSTITQLYLDRNKIHELQRESFKDYNDIIEIYMTQNELRSINDGVFDHITTLVKLDLSVNQITKLPADFGPSTTGMRIINLHSGIADPAILTYPYFGAFTNLELLDVNVARFGNVSDSFFPPNTGFLGMVIGTMVTFPRLSSLTPIVKWVYISDHRIGAIPDEAVGSLPLLLLLDVSNNRVVNFPNFSNCKRLETLLLKNNEIPFIPRQHVEGLESIQELQLGENNLTKMIDISYLSTLRIFGIGSNFISEIPESYIMGLLNMEVFACEENELIFLPNISNFFPRLQTLSVHGNKLKTLLDLYVTPPLSTLTAADNPLVCNQSLCWMRMWPWMRPSLTALQDRPLWDQPLSSAQTEVLRFHPSDMECYNGE